MKALDVITLQDNIRSIENKRLPVRLSFILFRNSKRINEAVEDIEQKRVDILSNYAERDSDGNFVTNEKGDVKVNNPEKLMSEMNELFDTDVSLLLETISFEDIQRCDDEAFDSLTVKEVEALSYMTGDE